MINLFKNTWKIQDESYAKHVKIIRFLISGGTATVANFSILFVLTHFFKVWYVLSEIIAFLCAFGISFVLQKFWTWRNSDKEKMHKQAVFFMLVALAGLITNIVLLYALVEFLHLHYLVAQVGISIFIATMNYLAYNKIFKKL